MAKMGPASRKEQKRQERVLLKRKLKLERNNVIAELKKVALPNDELGRLHSTASMQTKGLKRFLDERSNETSRRPEPCLDAVAIVKRKRRKVVKQSREFRSDSESSVNTDDMSSESESETNPQDKFNEKPQVKTSQPQNIPVQPKEELRQVAKEQIASEKSSDRTRQRQPAVYVRVYRDSKVEEARNQLPIVGEEQRIMEKIRYNDVVVISGETGSGKTTQLPQFLYEAGYALNGKMIGITEPRRVAAVAMSERVAHELNADEVSYQIRFSGNVTDKTRIKFMTDGVLLRECQDDLLLAKYSVLIIDEAHERSVFSDILIGLLSRIVNLRSKRGDPLKLVIMSATLRVSDFTENQFLFPRVPPIVKISARQHPVTIHFCKKTPEDYISAAYKKVCSVHSKMPTKGGILVFVTSQLEVKSLCRKLRREAGLHCLELFAMLPIEKQRLVFKKPPENHRLCVIATNVAETSITIPDIRYVIDTGKEKRKIFDIVTGISRFDTTWTSKSSAEQRTGRAGRMGPGFCFRLYSSAVFTNDFPEYAEPQILQKPVDDIVLQMKSMNIDNVVNFPFPTRPSIEGLKAAERNLISLGALDDSLSRNKDKNKTLYASRLTSLGKAMSKFAISARCSKMVVLAPTSLLPHVTCIVSAMTVREMLMNGLEWRELRKKWVGHGYQRLLGDYMAMLQAVRIAEKNNFTSKSCLTNGLRPKSMLEVHKLREHLITDIKKNLNHSDTTSGKKIRRPSEQQCKILRQILLSSFFDRIARRLPDGEIVEEKDPLSGPVRKKLKGAYECADTGEHVYISPESVLKGEQPSYVIYRELYKNEKKMYMRDIAVIEPEWLPFYADKLCKFGDMQVDSVKYDTISDQIVCARSVSYGPLNWALGVIDVPMHLVETGVELYKYFAYFLLSGDIIRWFKKYATELLTPPSTMLKPWSKLQPRTNKILQALLSGNIKSKNDFNRMLKQDPEYLLKEYLAWLPERMHADISRQWVQSVCCQ